MDERCSSFQLQNSTLRNPYICWSQAERKFLLRLVGYKQLTMEKKEATETKN